MGVRLSSGAAAWGARSGLEFSETVARAGFLRRGTGALRRGGGRLACRRAGRLARRKRAAIWESASASGKRVGARGMPRVARLRAIETRLESGGFGPGGPSSVAGLLRRVDETPALYGRRDARHHVAGRSLHHERIRSPCVLPCRGNPGFGFLLDDARFRLLASIATKHPASIDL